MNCSDRLRTAAGILLAGLMLAGCAASPRFAGKGERAGSNRSSPSSSTPSSPSTPIPSTGRSLLTLEGIASYYAHDFNGKLTSNGETYDMYAMTAAHRTFPFGTKIRVTNLENGRSTIVRVNDRGPFHEGRLIDLSLAAAKELDVVKSGTARVRLEVVEWGNGK